MPPSPKPHVLAVQNIKGGVGKTTIAVNLAALLAEKHHQRVLLIDADPQCNASLYLLSDARFDERTAEKKDRTLGNLHDVFHGDVRYLDVVTGKRYAPARKASCVVAGAKRPGGGRLDLVCGSARLFEVQEIAAEVVVGRMKRWLTANQRDYQHVIIDCPPSISSLSLSALKAADGILVPMTADQFSLHGLPLLLDTLKEYKKLFNIRATISGVVLSMFPPSSDATAQTRASQFGKAINALCANARVPFLRSRISKADAYPISFESREPLPFSAHPDHQWLIAELESLASELQLTGGSP